ncbi:MAG TPA: hypothetical protein VHU84_10020 [Lacipirellulaceae bacterium]|nr:hypothetical protein [Lacipirellulaceae bacterium]
MPRGYGDRTPAQYQGRTRWAVGCRDESKSAQAAVWLPVAGTIVVPIEFLGFADGNDDDSYAADADFPGDARTTT